MPNNTYVLTDRNGFNIGTEYTTVNVNEVAPEGSLIGSLTCQHCTEIYNVEGLEKTDFGYAVPQGATVTLVQRGSQWLPAKWIIAQ